MKKVFIIHGWGGNPDEPLLVWLDTELQKKGYEVVRPAMPNSLEPKIEVWVTHLASLVGVPDENTYFIGHSIGCQTIMRYLSTLPENIKVGGALFIAGWFNLAHLEEYDGEGAEEIGKPWIENPIDFEAIKKVCQEITVFLSTNEPYEYVEENKHTFEEKLNAKVVLMENKGHFTAEDGVVSLPEALPLI
jgi:predicted alpha/beta hydrolase family esterase